MWQQMTRRQPETYDNKWLDASPKLKQLLLNAACLLDRDLAGLLLNAACLLDHDLAGLLLVFSLIRWKVPPCTCHICLILQNAMQIL